MAYLCLFIAIFLGFAVLRVPLPFSMGLGTMVTLAVAGLKIEIMPPSAFSGVDAFAFLAIPGFIYAGDLMAQGGISTALLSFIGAVMQRLRGSLGAVAVVGSMLFGTITGSSLATVSAIGGIMMPDMIKSGYSKSYATALIAASGFLGILIPPSVPGVIYALTANLPVADVWLATAGPGLLLGLLYIVINYLTFGRIQGKVTTPFQLSSYLRDVRRTTPRALVACLMPIIILYGVYGGIFTPTEAGAVSVVVGMMIIWVIFPIVFRTKTDQGFWAVVRKSALTSAAIMMIIAFAHPVSEMISYTRISTALTNFIMEYTSSTGVFLLLVNVLLLVVGMFMETNTSILLFTPILLPVAKAYGVDPVHFSAICLLNLELGMISPPFAVNLFTACRMANISMDKVLKPLLPFLAAGLVVLGVTTYLPQVALFIVKLSH